METEGLFVGYFILEELICYTMIALDSYANLVVLGTLNLAKTLKVRTNHYELFSKTNLRAKKPCMVRSRLSIYH